MFGSFLPSLWSLSNQSLLGSRTDIVMQSSGHLPRNNSLWASKTGNSGHMESVTCDLGRAGVFGQPQPGRDVYAAHAQLPRTGLLARHSPEQLGVAEP